MAPEEVEPYILLLLNGDRNAVEPLVRHLHNILYPFVRRLVALDRIEDCIQATIAYFLSRVAEGRIEYHSVPQLQHYLKLIARWQAREIRSGNEVQFPERPDGDPWEPAAEPAGQPSHAETVARLLDQLLDAALAAESPEQRDRAVLEKLAFDLFYVDRLSQTQVTETLQRYGRPLGIVISTADVNNWLSGGRILKKIVSYVLRHRSQGICAAICSTLSDSGATERDWDTLDITMRQSKQKANEVVLNIVKLIKADLHEVRRKGA